MRIEKKVLAELDKCYAVTSLHYRGKDCFLVAAEKVERCLLFDADGEIIDTVWREPGGIMTMLQVPGSDGVFLATHKFYSPNDSKQAKIVVVSPQKEGGWEVRTLVELPFVHRFDILQSEGKQYLLACTLKSDHEYKDDWRFPGKVYAAELPAELDGYGDDNPLKMEVICEDFGHNHGYCHMVENGVESGLISCDSGVYRFYPPKAGNEQWKVEKILDERISDATLVDLDGDGEVELAAIKPFHGDTFSIYRKTDGAYHEVYRHEPMEFSHAIFGGKLLGVPSVLIGHRKGARDLNLFRYDKAERAYTCTTLDHDVGPANVLCFHRDGKAVIISANRETNEVAMYTLSE